MLEMIEETSKLKKDKKNLYRLSALQDLTDIAIVLNNDVEFYPQVGFTTRQVKSLKAARRIILKVRGEL